MAKKLILEEGSRLDLKYLAKFFNAIDGNVSSSAFEKAQVIGMKAGFSCERLLRETTIKSILSHPLSDHYTKPHINKNRHSSYITIQHLC